MLLGLDTKILLSITLNVNIIVGLYVYFLINSVPHKLPFNIRKLSCQVRIDWLDCLIKYRFIWKNVPPILTFHSNIQSNSE